MRTTSAFNLLFVALAAAAMILPRLLPRGEGLAAGATAALTFLVLASAAALVAALQSLATVRRRATLSPSERWLGHTPLLLTVCGVLVFLVVLYLSDRPRAG